MAGDICIFLFLIRSLKKVSVLSVNLQSHTTASAHCMVKKRRREGLYSFDLRNALDILMPHHFMGTGLPDRRTQQEPSFWNLFTQGRVSGTL